MKLKIILTAAAAAGILGITGTSAELAYREKIYPGVTIAGLEAGGKRPDEAANLVETKAHQMESWRLVQGNQEWKLTAGEMGIKYDIEQSVEAAWKVGRSENWERNLRDRWTAIKTGWDIDPVMVIDENLMAQVLTTISGQINIPAMEPEIVIKKDSGSVDILAGENGQEVEEAVLKQRIMEAARQMAGGVIEIPVVQLRPKLGQDQLETARKRVEQLRGKRLMLEFLADKQTWEIGEEQWVGWLDPADGPGRGGWKREEIEEWVAELAKTVDRPAQNASLRFVGNGRVEEFKPAKNGYQVRQGDLAEKIIWELVILEGGEEKERKVEVVADETTPQIQTGDVNDLGIRELLGKGESWFVGSITNRIFNLRKAAEALNGVLVAPGETFSFNKTVGEISSATGYKSAYIIKEGQTILGDGGGVCQTSTTLFRAVLAAGLPIEERVAHAYRVSYYEQNYQVGYDATVFQPSPDFKFKNDTPGYVLIQTEFSEKEKRLAFYLYGTSDGRNVEISKARIWDVIPPPPDLYIDDPSLPAGQVVQTEHAARGAKVAFDWKVTRGEEILQERTFYSVYRAWQAVYLRGTRVN